MELFTGGDLRTKLTENFKADLGFYGFPEKTVRKLFGEIGSGLLYMHNLGIAHLDLKPGNII